jgi:transcriptional regulator with XRE-family HTH domain
MAELESEREQIGNRIRDLRQLRKLSLQQLAKLASMSPGYLSEVERGHSAISGEKLAKIAEHLGTSVDYLLSGREEAKEPTVINIPPGLSEAAKLLDLSFTDTLRLLEGKRSLVARRSGNAEVEWTKDDWINFYNKVKAFF